MAQGIFVAYYRVSTARQGRSGLGLDAQRRAVADFLNGGSWELSAEFVEVESGKVDDRPQLEQALATCELSGATLVVAKLDRLSRNLAFLAKLQESGARFVAADMAEANELTIHIMAAVAQAERKAISIRTKEALAAAKATGRAPGRQSRQSRRSEEGAGKERRGPELSGNGTGLEGPPSNRSYCRCVRAKQPEADRGRTQRPWNHCAARRKVARGPGERGFGPELKSCKIFLT